MMGPSPRCYIPSFVEIGQLVPEKFLRVFAIDGRGGHLGHVTKIPGINFVPPTHRGSTQNRALIGQVVSEKMFEIVDG